MFSVYVPTAECGSCFRLRHMMELHSSLATETSRLSAFFSGNFSVKVDTLPIGFQTPEWGLELLTDTLKYKERI